MKIAVTCDGSDLQAPLDRRFGRCPNLLIIETDDMTCQALANPFIEQASGVGGRLASWLAERHIGAVLTGTPGPHAQQALEAAGILVVTGCSGTARKAVEAFKTCLARFEKMASHATNLQVKKIWFYGDYKHIEYESGPGAIRSPWTASSPMA